MGLMQNLSLPSRPWCCECLQPLQGCRARDPCLVWIARKRSGFSGPADALDASHVKRFVRWCRRPNPFPRHFVRSKLPQAAGALRPFGSPGATDKQITDAVDAYLSTLGADEQYMGQLLALLRQ